MYIRFFVLSSVPSLPSASLSCQQAVEDLLLALTRVPQAVPQMVQTVVPFFSQVRLFPLPPQIFWFSCRACVLFTQEFVTDLLHLDT